MAITESSGITLSMTLSVASRSMAAMRSLFHKEKLRTWLRSEKPLAVNTMVNTAMFVYTAVQMCVCVTQVDSNDQRQCGPLLVLTGYSAVSRAG